MFDKLEDLLVRLEEILSELQEPDVANDSQETFDICPWLRCQEGG